MKTNKCPLLEFRNITVLKGGGRKILDGVSFSIHEGENVAIIGPNGAGKSSLIKLITREYYPAPVSSGSSLKIWGQERWNVAGLRSLLGIVSNDLQYACARDISGMEMILSGFFSSIGLFRQRPTAAMKKKALKVMEFLGIGHLKGRSMDMMSSGEARRFLIARALVHRPRALVLDEPSTSLDLQARGIFSDMLRKIAGAGTSIILVTQDISEIIPEIKRVVLMKGGRFYDDGPKKDMLTDRKISRLFGVPIEVILKGGYYYALRGSSAGR